MLNSVERISILIPKFKQQLIFLEEREKLFKEVNDYSIQCNDASSNVSTNFQPLATVSTNPQVSASVPINSQSQSFVPATATTVDHLSNASISDLADQSGIDTGIYTPFPDDYKIPPLPHPLIKDIDDGILVKFGPHCSHRRILIDAIAYDLIENYNLFYPEPKAFDNIGNSIVKFLKLPLTKENIGIWKDALQTKLKRKRSECPNNTVVQEHRMKYSKPGSGRPVKRQLGTTAERDRYKQMMMIISSDDAISDDIKSKADQLRDTPEIDFQTQLCLWKETLHFRRQSIRDRPTSDILKDFPGYGNPLLVFEEVRMLTKIDLSAAVRRQIPVLLDKLVEAPGFITDSPPIRLIKILCREFDETVQHTFCDTEPPTPYPTMVFINDRIHIYVDFNLIVSTNSPDDALALLVGMYTIFELSFNKKSRTMRLLYLIVHCDKRCLSNTIRNLIKEKNIDIYSEQQYQVSSSSNLQSNTSTTLVVESQAQLQVDTNSPDEPTIDPDYPIVSQIIETAPSNDVSDSHLDVLDHSNEYSNITENTSALSSCNSEFETKKRKRQRKNSNSGNQDDALPNDGRKTNDQRSISNRRPLNDVTNATSAPRQTKRKRRS